MTKKINLLLTRLSRKLKLARPLNMPSNIMIEPTNICNLKCPGCPTGRDDLPFKKGKMKLSDFRTLLDELGPYAVAAQLWGFGEPFLHPEIFEMVAYCKKFGIAVRLSTNGQNLDGPHFAEKLVKSGLDSLKISLDGASQETLQKYRVNASFDKIVSSIHAINEVRKRNGSKHPRLILQFIVMKHNQHEIPLMRELAKKLEMKYKQKSVYVEDFTAEDLLPDDDRYSRYIRDAGTGTLRPAQKQPELCPFVWEWAMVNWDGTVSPCCKDPYRNHLFGNVLETSYKSIWRSPEFVDFRRRLLKNPAEVEKCNRCVLV
jgi:radical SAM protein with 4Fe4S-binding SPASM domain